LLVAALRMAASTGIFDRVRSFSAGAAILRVPDQISSLNFRTG
jgi:hypothetical protein